MCAVTRTSTYNWEKKEENNDSYGNLTNDNELQEWFGWTLNACKNTYGAPWIGNAVDFVE